MIHNIRPGDVCYIEDINLIVLVLCYEGYGLYVAEFSYPQTVNGYLCFCHMLVSGKDLIRLGVL